MIFIPAVANFSISPALTPAAAPLPLLGAVMSNNLTIERMANLKLTPDSLTAKVFRRQLPRARKARARLRQQHKLRTAVAVRNN
jgi:hypothetical protein